MKIKISRQFQKSFGKLTKKNSLLSEKIKTKVTLFRNDINHPSLKVHKLTGKLNNAWSFSVNEDIRILFIYNNDHVLFVEIGGHDKVY